MFVSWLKHNQARQNKFHRSPVFLIVAIWRVSGGLGLYCGGKNILGRVVFQLFGRKFLGNYIRLNFLCSFQLVLKKLSHKNAIKMTWGVIFWEKKMWWRFQLFLAGKGAVSDLELLETLSLQQVSSTVISVAKRGEFSRFVGFLAQKGGQIFEDGDLWD